LNTQIESVNGLNFSIRLFAHVIWRTLQRTVPKLVRDATSFHEIATFLKPENLQSRALEIFCLRNAGRYRWLLIASYFT